MKKTINKILGLLAEIYESPDAPAKIKLKALEATNELLKVRNDAKFPR